MFLRFICFFFYLFLRFNCFWGLFISRICLFLRCICFWGVFVSKVYLFLRFICFWVLFNDGSYVWWAVFFQIAHVFWHGIALFSGGLLSIWKKWIWSIICDRSVALIEEMKYLRNGVIHNINLMFRSSYDNLVHTYVCTIYCKKTRAQNEFPQMFDIVRV